MNLYLIRHGRSIGNENPEAYYQMPEWKIPLTAEGKKQAENVGKNLSDIDSFYMISSPYVRARETATIIKKQIKTIYSSYQESPLIIERAWGNLRDEVNQFETREERNHLFDFYRRPTGGESFADVYQRAFVFLEYLKNNFKYDQSDPWNKENNIIIVSHGEFLKVLLMIIDGNTVEEFDGLPNPKNCQIIQRTIKN
jgi:broad specificity phosphatase PhoE